MVAGARHSHRCAATRADTSVHAGPTYSAVGGRHNTANGPTPVANSPIKKPSYEGFWLLPNHAGSGRKVVAVVELEAERESSDSDGLEALPVIKLLEQAEEFQTLLSSGAVTHRAELARQHGLTRARVTQLMNLLELHPVVLAYVRSLPSGIPMCLVTERKLRRLTRLPQEQQIDEALRELAGFADFVDGEAGR